MTPSADLAGLLLIVGIISVIACARSLFVPPPHYLISADAGLVRNLTWAGLLAGIIMILASLYVAYQVWSSIVQCVSSAGG